jgi:hypothetical protein
MSEIGGPPDDQVPGLVGSVGVVGFFTCPSGDSLVTASGWMVVITESECLAHQNRLIRRLLRTGRQPAGPALCRLSGQKGNDHFCQDSICPRARPVIHSRSASRTGR